MSTPDPEDDVLLDYVAAFREVERPDPDVAAQTWAEIERATTPRRTPWIAVAVIAMAASLLLALLVDWRGLLSDTPDPEPSQAPYEATPKDEVHGLAPGREGESVPAPAPAPEVPPAPVPEDVPKTEPAPAPPTKRAAAPKPKSKPATGPSTLAEETALLRAIQEALVQNKANQALGKVAAYRQRFPKGVFRSEVTVAKAQALCKVGRPDQARAVADGFIKRHPKSHLVKRAKTICRP